MTKISHVNDYGENLLESLRQSDLVVVGSGFYGLTVAERAATNLGARVCVLERRKHLGGNAWSELHPGTDIEVHKYGSHLFHTSNQKVWDYVTRFSSFTDYRHVVWGKTGDKMVPLPFTLATINLFFGRTFSPPEAESFMRSQRTGDAAAAGNLEERAVALVGRELYEGLIAGYTEKQWQTPPVHLPAEVISRLPVRMNYDLNYFSDKYQGLPVHGYGALLTRLATHPLIQVYLNTDYFSVREHIPTTTPIVYTGPIDRYFEFREGALSWRTLDFEWELLDTPDFQGTSVINYCDIEVPFTRVHEFRHLHPERSIETSGTVIAREFSRFANESDEPYYPINSPMDRAKLSRYRQATKAEERVVFGGRLGSYQYLDMHMAIASALSAFDARVGPLVSDAKGSKRAE